MRWLWFEQRAASIAGLAQRKSGFDYPAVHERNIMSYKNKNGYTFEKWCKVAGRLMVTDVNSDADHELTKTMWKAFLNDKDPEVESLC